MPRRVLIVLALLLLVAAAGVTTYGVKTRTEGHRLLDAVLEQHEAGGYGTSFADLYAAAPAVDPERQARLHAWMRERIHGNVGMSACRDLGWRLEGKSAPPEKVLEAHEAFRQRAEELALMFAEGELCLTSLGWLPEDPSSATFSDRVGGHIPNLLAVRAAYKWFAVEASLVEETSRPLGVLDRLHRGLAQPGCVIDSMISVACDCMRDDSYLVLALSGRLSKERLEAWLAEAPRSARLVAEGLRGERLRFAAPLGRALIEGETVSENMGGEWDIDGVEDVWKHHIRPWIHAARDCAVYLDGALAVERHVLGEIPRDEMERLVAPCEDLGQPFSLMLMNYDAILVTANSSADRHQLVRLAVELATAGMAGKPLPEVLDESETQRFRYVLLAPDRFRLGMQVDPKDGWYGFEDPVSERPLEIRHNMIEIQLPGATER